jgi:cyanate lyase
MRLQGAYSMQTRSRQTRGPQNTSAGAGNAETSPTHFWSHARREAEVNVDKTEMTHWILKAKKSKQLSWEALANTLGMSELWVASCCYGENSMTPETAGKLCAALDLGAEIQEALVEFPTKGNSLEGKLVPTDPLMYRFYEILCVYGKALKDSIQEKCGDGIMSAIDFTLDVQKVEHPKGDRIVVTMDGKFLPYRRF